MPDDCSGRLIIRPPRGGERERDCEGERLERLRECDGEVLLPLRVDASASRTVFNVASILSKRAFVSFSALLIDADT